MGLSNYSSLKKYDGTVWATGHNNFGQLGLGDATDRNIFTKVNITDVKSVVSGYNFTFIIKNDDTVWATGNNAFGQLGLGDTTNRTTFTKVNVSDVKDIYCSGSYTLTLKNDGTVWTTGNNSSGQLGLGDKTNRSTFTKVNITDVKSIACGNYHTTILKNDGTLWACGINTSGQLGLGDNTDRTSFTKVNITDVKYLSCGYYHVFALKNDGTLWATGHGTYGELGLGDTTHRYAFTKVAITDVKSISCGDVQAIVLKNDGTVWATGSNAYGQLGLGDLDNRNTFTKVNISDVKDIACGYSHTFILKNDGTVWVCGLNSSGQLGLGDNTQRTSFTKVGITDAIGLWGNTQLNVIKYLIKTLQSIYTIDTGLKILSEIRDTLTSQIIQQNGVDIATINKNIGIFPDEFSLVSDVDFGLEINGLKNNTQMIVASNDFITTIQDNIDYFKSESYITETSKVKLVFSIDGGATWKTHNGNTFVDLTVKIPCKDYAILTEDEIGEWNESKAKILESGIDSNALHLINFNTLNFDKIRFTYALHIADEKDVARTTKLLWQFDSKGSMQQLKDSEFDLKLHSAGIEFKPLIDTDMVKINILPNGVGVSEDIEFATESEIENLFN